MPNTPQAHEAAAALRRAADRWTDDPTHVRIATVRQELLQLADKDDRPHVVAALREAAQEWPANSAATTTWSDVRTALLHLADEITTSGQ